MHFVILQNIYYKQQLVECFILLHIKFSPSGYVIRTWFLKILLRKFCRLFSWTLKVRIRICLSLIGSGLSPYSISSPAGTEAGTFLKTFLHVTFFVAPPPSHCWTRRSLNIGSQQYLQKKLHNIYIYIY